MNLLPPAATLFMQSKPNFRRFCVKNTDCEEKQTQSKPNQTQFPTPTHEPRVTKHDPRTMNHEQRTMNLLLPAATLFMQNEPNFRRFCLKNADCEEKRTQNEPKRTQFRNAAEPLSLPKGPYLAPRCTRGLLKPPLAQKHRAHLVPLLRGPSRCGQTARKKISKSREQMRTFAHLV
jgi:hypothetical protein